MSAIRPPSISGWARDSVYFMAANKIINGVGNNKFAPKNTTTAEEAVGYANATREQALAIAVRMVWECAQAVSIPLCGIGGVCSGEDAAEMILAGATAVSVGTANLYDPTCVPRILAELGQWAAEQGVSDISELRGAFEC